MYGFGDAKDPDENTMILLESYVEEFIKDLIIRGYNRSLKAGYSKIRVADILFQIQDNEQMFMRAYKLLTNLDSVEKARKRQGMDTISDLAKYANNNAQNSNNTQSTGKSKKKKIEENANIKQ